MRVLIRFDFDGFIVVFLDLGLRVIEFRLMDGCFFVSVYSGVLGIWRVVTCYIYLFGSSWVLGGLRDWMLCYGNGGIEGVPEASDCAIECDSMCEVIGVHGLRVCRLTCMHNMNLDGRVTDWSALLPC